MEIDWQVCDISAKTADTELISKLRIKWFIEDVVQRKIQKQGNKIQKQSLNTDIWFIAYLREIYDPHSTRYIQSN